MLLLFLTLFPLPGDLNGPLGGAQGVESQRDPTACEAFGDPWTSCENAFASDDVYALSNSVPGGVQVDAVNHTTGNGMVHSWNHTTGGQDDRLLVVGLSFRQAAGPTAGLDVRYAGSSVSFLRGDTHPGNARTEIWYLTNPPSGVQTIAVTLTAGEQFVGGSLSAYNVNQTVPLGNSTSNQGTGTLATTTLASAVDDLVLDVLGVAEAGTATVGPGQANRWNDRAGGGPNAVVGAGSTEAGAANVTMSWALSASRAWVLSAVNVHTAARGELPGRNDTAWRAFGIGLDPSDTVQGVEVGVEWFRLDGTPILNVTVSWDGGSSWATSQRAANKSADNDLPEFLDFTSATAWDAARLNDANFRVRVATNASGARLDHVAVRVTYVDVILDLSLTATTSAVDPGDEITLNASIRNLGSGPAQSLLIEGLVDPNTTYVSSTPMGAFDMAARTIRWAIPALPSGGATNVEWTIRVNPGTPDRAIVTSRARVEAEDSGGMALPPEEASTDATVRAPIFSPVLRLDRADGERGDEVTAVLYYNNTGSGMAGQAWSNWTLRGHYELLSLLPAVPAAPTPEGFTVSWTNVTGGPHSLVVRLRIVRGMEDGLVMGLQVAWAATDANGNALPETRLPAAVTLFAPVAALSLAAPTEPVEAGTPFTLNVTLRNLGQGGGTGWLNLTLPGGAAYVGDDGAFVVTATGDTVGWRIPGLAAGSTIRLGIELRAEGESRVEAFRLTLDFSDGRGSPTVTVLSNAASVEIVRGPFPPAPWPWWLALLGVAGGLFAAFFFVRRLRSFSIEEVFVMDRKGLLIAHLSRTLTPDKDNDLLAAMLKTMQDFVKDAFSGREDVPMKSLSWGEYTILVEQGSNHYVSVIYKGKDRGTLASRLKRLSEQIDSEFGEMLEAWRGQMREVRGIRELLPSLWISQLNPLDSLGILRTRLTEVLRRKKV